jgi:tape measure domain-containing protein
MDLATLQIKVDAKEAIRDTDRLGESLTKAGKKAEFFTDAQGRLRHESGRYATAAEKAAQGTTKMSGSMEDAAGSAKMLYQTLVAYGALRVVQQLGQMADTAKLVSARLALVTKGAADLARVQSTLFASAQRTGSAYEDVATLYTRVARNAGTLGKSQADLLKFTELVNMSIVSSGASSSEASAGVLQLSQALAKGRLDGDEFRSVMENMPQVADALTASLGITKGQLYEFAREGKITGATVVDAMLSMEQQTRTAFERMPLTIARAIQMAKNDILRFVSEVDGAVGASGFFATMIKNAPGAVGRVMGGTTLGTLARSAGGMFPRSAASTSSGLSATVGTGSLGGMPFLGAGTRAEHDERQAWAEAQAKAMRRAAWEEEAITRALRLGQARFMAENPGGPARPGASATSMGFDERMRGILDGRGVTQLPVGMRTSEYANSTGNQMKAQVQEMTAAAAQMADSAKMVTENFLRGIQSSFSTFFRDLFTTGISSFRGLMDSFKNLVINAFAELAAKRLMGSLFGEAGVGGLLGGLSGGAMLGIGVGAFALSRLFGGDGARKGYKKPPGTISARPNTQANDMMPRGSEIRSSVGSALQEGTAVRLFGTFEAMRQSLVNIEGLLRNGALMGNGTSSSGLDKALGVRSQSLRLAAGVAVVG